MKSYHARLITLLLAALGFGALVWWQAQDPTRAFTRNDPGVDPRQADASEVVQIGQRFSRFAGQPADWPGEWPSFRGAGRDNIVHEQVKLANTWDEAGPPRLWRVELGEGHAAPAVHKGRVYLLDYNETKQADFLRCLSLADGSNIWQRGYGVHLKRNHGFSRTVPAIAAGKVVTIGPRCHVMCVDAESGDLAWGIDLVKDYGSTVPFWYTGQCPYIDGTTVVLAPASPEVLLMGIDIHSGQVLWTTPNTLDVTMSHSSVMPMTLNERRMYVYAGIGAMIGVAADGADAGTLLWHTTAFKASVIAPSPLIFDDGRIYLTGGYGAGSMTVQVTAGEAGFAVALLNKLTPKDGLSSEQQTPLLYKGKIFAIMPKDGGELRNQFVCGDPIDSTRFIYTSGKTNRFGLGPYIAADDKLYVLNDDGTLVMLDAVANAYRELGRARIVDGQDAWGPLVIVGGRMLLRDSSQMVCIDLRDGHP